MEAVFERLDSVRFLVYVVVRDPTYKTSIRTSNYSYIVSSFTLQNELLWRLFEK